MTDSGKAADQNLTEDANAPGNAEGNYVCPLATTHCRCPLRTIHTAGCDCVTCEERWNIRLSHRVVDTNDGHGALQRSTERLVAAWDHWSAAQTILAKRAAHAANIAKMHKGSWAFTLTYSPQKTGWSHDEAKDHMRTAIQRLRHYYRHDIEEFHAVGELTTAGAPHVHGHYTLIGGKRITTKNFKRAYPIWNPDQRIGTGHVGGYHKPAKSESDYSGYIQKDLDTAWLVETYPDGPTQEASGPEAEGGGSSAPPGPTPPDRPAPEHDDW